MSDPERWMEIKRIAQAALDLPEEERAKYLDDACGGDVELRREVEALLAVSETQAQIIDNLQVLPDSLRRIKFAEGDVVGAYRIIRPLSEGGMGAVYLAYDTRHHRQVALKTFPRGDHVLTHEQQILAKLPHENIAALYDSGVTTDGVGYFVMEYVNGEPITTYCDRKGLAPRERLKLFATVCSAVSFAHRNFVVHRDIKPSNVLVTDAGVPKLLDFGIAKLLPVDAAALTLTRPEDRSLTVAFASPEQLDGERTTIATDVYSLGVLLCLLLTGRLPYPVKSYGDLPWAIRNMEAERPSRLVLKDPRPAQGDESSARDPLRLRRRSRYLRGDLDAIVLKALRKEPAARYETVADLAADIRRALADQPVSARRGSYRYYVEKFVRRHSISVSASAITVLLILGLIVGLFLQLREAARQRDIASENAKQAETSLQFLTDLFDKTNSWSEGRSPQTPEQFIDQAAGRLDLDFHDQPQIHARLLTVLASIYTRLSRYDKATMLVREALLLQEHALETTHPDIGETLSVLGGLKLKEGKYDEAERAMSRSLSIARVHAREDPAPLASRLSNLSLLRTDQGKPIEAESLAREALAICKAHPRDTRKHLDNALHHLARALRAQDRFQEATVVIRRVIRLKTETHGTTHPSTATALQTLADLYHDMGDHAREEIEARKALAIMEATLPPENPDRLALKSTVAGALAHLGRYRESEQLYREVLEVSRQVLPPQHKGLGSAVNNVAYSLLKQKKVKEALPLFLEALTITERARGHESKHVAIMLDNIGVCRSYLGQFEEADATFQEAIRVSRVAFGDTSVGTALTLKSYGKTKLDRSQFAEARELFQEATDILRAKLPNNHPQRAQAQSLLGASCFNLGEFEKGEKLLLDAYQILDAEQDGDRGPTREALEHLVSLYQRWGKPAEAEKYERLLAREVGPLPVRSAR